MCQLGVHFQVAELCWSTKPWCPPNSGATEKSLLAVLVVHLRASVDGGITFVLFVAGAGAYAICMLYAMWHLHEAFGEPLPNGLEEPWNFVV